MKKKKCKKKVPARAAVKSKRATKVKVERSGGNTDYDGSAPLKSLMQEMFVENLLRGMNQSEAYRQSGYRGKRPDSQAHQLMLNNGVRARLAYRRAELQTRMREETAITERKVLDEIARLAFSNMQDFITTDADGNIIFRDLEHLRREQMAAVESVKITRTTTKNRRGDNEYTTQHTQFKLHNKTANLEQLGRHLGLFEVDNAQKRQALQINILKFSIGGNGNGKPKTD